MKIEAFFDVEIRVFRRSIEGYSLSLRSWYGEEVVTELPPPPEELKDPTVDPRRYGILVFNWLLRDRVADAFWKARSAASVPPGSSFLSAEGGLRLRLWLDDLPSHLATLRWEVLQAPDDYLPLSLCTAFSRFVRVRARPAEPLYARPLRILQIFASPIDLEAFGLPALDPALDRLADRLAGSSFGSLMTVDRLEGPVTLEAIQQRLERGYHVLYVVAHTMLRDHRLHLVLTDESGRSVLVAEETIGAVLGRQARFPPQLVILATPATGLDVAGSMYAAVTPQLLKAGIQSVLISELPQESRKLQSFNETFFRVLVQTGVIDVAVAQARAEIFDTKGWDWSYPVLVMRSRDAQLFEPLDISVQQNIGTVAKGATVIGAVIGKLGTPDDEVRHG